jgi:hypothetical protein
MTGKTASPRDCGLYRLLAAGLLSAAASAVIALPAATAEPCNKTFGESAAQTVQSYLDRHPDVKAQLTSKSQSEGGNGSLIDYLDRHPDVRQALITLANECTS